MFTPYDWQEGMSHRAQYIESRLAQSTPVAAVSLEAGIVFVAYYRSANKIFEIYDQLALGALGQQSDVEAVRMAAIDFAHQEGYNRSEAEVTVKRVVHTLSTPIKRAFADFNAAPFVARALVAEVCASPDCDQYVMIDFDGDFHFRKNYGFIGQTQAAADILDEQLEAAHLSTASIESAVEELSQILKNSIEPDPDKTLDATIATLKREVALLERNSTHEVRFRHLSEWEQ